MKVKFYLEDEDQDANGEERLVPPRSVKKFKKNADDEFAAVKQQKKQKEKFSRSTLRKHHEGL